MESILNLDIRRLAKAKALEHHYYHNTVHLEYLRNKKRIKNPPAKVIQVPLEWASKTFNPFYVLRHSKQIARSIAEKILSGRYEPKEPERKKIKKPGGGHRTISIYSLPDSAVSYRFYVNLLGKNKHRLSSLSYAYRNDRNVHFAIQDIANDMRSTSRIFIAEFDFSDFFGSINHDFIRRQFDKNAFLISEKEKEVIFAFLNQQPRGIPLGTSISLFIANMVCWKLDRSLEDEGLRFARYADDTIIWSHDYTKICRAFNIISEFSVETGVKINYKKSSGISILQKKGMPSEFKNTKESIEFLGYNISVDKVGIKRKAEQRIKKQISYLLYRNLIQPIKDKPFRGVEFPSNGKDKDFLRAIMQVRRYLYGNLSEANLKKYVVGAHKRLTFKGIMSFYPLIDDVDQLKSLDRWLVSTILNTLNKRKKLFLGHGYSVPNGFPFNQSVEQLLRICKETEIYEKKGLMEIPSFLRIHKAIKKGLTNDGIERVMNPGSKAYYED